MTTAVLRRPRVIIVDDDPMVRRALQSFFTACGYDALACESPDSVCPATGPKAAMCAGGSPCCDVLVTDVSMPGESGLDFLERQAAFGCRLDARNRAVISGALDGDGQRRVRSLGATFFNKPFEFRTLSEWLRACEGRLDLNLPLATRRREARFPCRRDVHYSIEGGTLRHAGIVLDVSPSGLRLCAESPLRAGQELHIGDTHLPAGQAAVVRWVSPEAGGNYLAGIHVPAAGGDGPG